MKMKREKISGIYKITNLVNGKMYIGQSIDIRKRWNLHKSMSKTGTEAICCAYRKYGFENFSFEIIEKCSPKDLNKKEIYYIEHFNTYKNGYNETKGGEGMSGWKISQTTKDKISASQAIKIAQIDFNGDLVGVFDGAGQAQKETGVLRQTINKCCLKQNKTGGGFIWMTYDDYLQWDKNIDKLSIPVIKRSVVQIDKKGNKINQFDSIAAAARATNSNAKCIDACCVGKNKITNNSIWMYLEDFNCFGCQPEKFINGSTPKAVVMYDKNNSTKKLFDSLSKAYRETGVSVGAIKYRIKNKKEINGISWQFYEGE